MRFWQTSTFRGVVLGAVSACITFAIRDVKGGEFALDDYVLVWLGAALAIVNRARQDDVSGFPTFGP